MAGLPVAFGASVLSYFYVEKPFRRRSGTKVAVPAPVPAGR
jgi:peptidoglycan/LPS O-acetylase OafA/YrhL